MPYDNIIGTKANDLDEFIGSIPDEQLILVPDPVTGQLLRSTFGQIKSDIITAFGGISYLDPIIEVDTVADLPQPGVIKTLYVITVGVPDNDYADANTQWRWGGSIYIEFPHGGDGDVAGEAAIRGNADAVLQGNIDAEATARENADDDLQTNITAEATARENADTTLQTNINAEKNARINADQTLQANINAETAARITADALKVDKVTGMGLSSNDYTSGEKTKLAGLESSHFKGSFVNLTALQSAYPTANVGDYADADAGAGADVTRFIWDDSDSKWILQQGASTAETAASIKTKYESNPDTNAYTDAEKTKLAGLTAISGTVNRISVTAGVIDIASTYIGQNSITTLGTISTGTWQGSTIASGYGGTGFYTYAKGDLIYASAADVLSKLAAGTDGYVLTMASGVPTWAAASGGSGSGSGWGLSGNAITSGDFIGTTNNLDLVFKINNSTKITLTTAGVLRFANTYPAAKVYYYDSGSAGGRRGVGFVGSNIQNFNASGLANGWTWNKGGDLQSNGINELMKLNGNGDLSIAGALTVPGLITASGGITLSGALSGITVITHTNAYPAIKQLYYDGGAGSGNRRGVGFDGGKIQSFTSSGVGSGWSWNGGGDLQPSGTNELMRLDSNTGILYLGGINPGSSAILKLNSTTMGFLQPRMTLTNWGSIASKEEGLQAWNNIDHAQLWFDGTDTIGFRFNRITNKFQGFDGINWNDLN